MKVVLSGIREEYLAKVHPKKSVISKVYNKYFQIYFIAIGI